jgi:hypothetical protein
MAEQLNEASIVVYDAWVKTLTARVANTRALLFLLPQPRTRRGGV